jgi:hypothetical protein
MQEGDVGMKSLYIPPIRPLSEKPMKLNKSRRKAVRAGTIIRKPLAQTSLASFRMPNRGHTISASSLYSRPRNSGRKTAASIPMKLMFLYPSLET